MEKIRNIFVIAIITLAASLTLTASAYALFTIPENERVNENDKNVDLATIYNEYAPDTLKLKSHEDTVNFLKGKNASCSPKPIPTPKLNRNLHIPSKKLLTKSINNNKNNIAGIIFLSVWAGFIILLATYVFIVKLRDTSEK